MTPAHAVIYAQVMLHGELSWCLLCVERTDAFEVDLMEWGKMICYSRLGSSVHLFPATKGSLGPQEYLFHSFLFGLKGFPIEK